MRHLLLFLSIVSSVSSELTPICTNNYTLVNNNKCLFLIPNETLYNYAQSGCGFTGGTLALSKNAVDNRAIATFVGNSVSRFWMGMYCIGNNMDNCIWDDRNGSAASYNNFAKGFPYVDIGNCVYYSTTGPSAGKWYNTDCGTDMHPYVCEMPVTYADSCKNNFNGNCYFIGMNDNWPVFLPFDRAQKFCEQQGANLASIHSPAEMRFINYMMMMVMGYGSITIGGVRRSANSIYWVDSTPWDYSPMIIESSPGCIHIDYPGWSTHNCEAPTVFLCKRPAGGQPLLPVAPITIAPFPTNSPGCNTSILLAPGEITSPNYPNNYDNNLICTYSLATVGPSRIKVNFIAFLTETNKDYLYFYDGDSAASPGLGSYTGLYTSAYASMIPPPQSTGNRMFLVFKTDGNVTDLGFHIKFSVAI